MFLFKVKILVKALLAQQNRNLDKNVNELKTYNKKKYENLETLSKFQPFFVLFIETTR